MKTDMKITILYDNYSFKPELEIDWGFACMVEINKNKILFDTGNSGTILLKNMEKLGIDPKSIDVVFLSHFHHDHTGGLKDFWEANSKVKAFYPRSFPNEIVNVIKHSGSEAIPISEFTEILPDVFTLGEIKGVITEQSLAVRSPKGIIVITGCAHPGIIDILQKAKDNFPDETIDLALGGFHLFRSNGEDVKNTVQKIFKMELLNIAPIHCTGSNARKIFREVFTSGYIEAGAGKIFNVNVK